MRLGRPEIGRKTGNGPQSLRSIGQIGRGVKSTPCPPTGSQGCGLSHLPMVRSTARHLGLGRCLRSTRPGKAPALDKPLHHAKNITRNTAPIADHGWYLTILGGVFLEPYIQPVELALHLLQRFDVLDQRLCFRLERRTGLGPQRIQRAVLLGQNILAIGHFTDQPMRRHRSRKQPTAFDLADQLHERSKTQLGDL